MELKSPVGAEGEVGDHVIADAGTDTGEVGGFTLVGDCLFNTGKAVIKEGKKLQFVFKLFLSDEVF